MKIVLMIGILNKNNLKKYQIMNRQFKIIINIISHFKIKIIIKIKYNLILLVFVFKRIVIKNYNL